MESILDVWIMNHYGICLYNQSKSNYAIEDENLFTGFLSGIQGFLKSIGEDRIKSIVLGVNKFTFYYLDETNLIIVIKSQRETKNKFIERKFKQIRDKFLCKYGLILDKHRENKSLLNLQIFNDFKEELSAV